jgi:hypothetical protein
MRPLLRLRCGLLMTVLLAVALLCPTALLRAHECTGEMVIGGVDRYDDFACAVDIAPDGTAWVVWTGYGEGTDPDEDIFYSTNSGGGWSTQALVHPDNERLDWSPEISIGSDGVPWVVWADYVSGQSYRLRVTHWTGSGWCPADTIHMGGGRYDPFCILAGSSSDVWISLSTYIGGNREILVFHWDGASWSQCGRLGTSGDDTYSVMAFGPGGRPWIVWSRWQPVVLCASLSDTGWTSPEVVNADAGNIGVNAIVFDGDTPMVLWTGNGDVGTGDDMKYSRKVDGEWTPSALVNQPDGDDDYDARARCHAAPDGSIWVVWEAGNTHEIFSANLWLSRWEGNGWSPDEMITDGAPNKQHKYPDMAIGPDGGMWVVWECYEEIAPPWDEDIRGLYCEEETTPVSFGPLEAEIASDGDEVLIWWLATDEAENGPFRLWRSDVTGAGGPPALPPGDADLLTESLLTGPTHEWQDDGVFPGRTYAYWAEWVRPGATSSVYAGPTTITLPGGFDGPARLLYVRPNPTRGGSCVGYEQSREGVVGLEVFSVAGRRVARVEGQTRGPGTYDGRSQTLCWDGRSDAGREVGSGVYLVRLLFDGRSVPGTRSRVVIVH